MLATDAGNLLRRKPLVHRAIALPKNDPGLAKRFRSVSSEFLVRIPHDHLIEGDAHAIPGIAPKMLIGEEKNLFAWLESPLQNLRGVGAGANRAAVFAREGLNGRRSVHVTDRNHVARIHHGGKVTPASFYLSDVGHVRQGTAGVEIG